MTVGKLTDSFDDWGLGVTPWGRTPAYFKGIVYTMRFDTASTKHAEFGPFYISYLMRPVEALDHFRV